MINGISDRQSTHLVQEPRSCVQTKARMLCFCMRHLPRPPLCTQKRRRNSKVNWKQKFWRVCCGPRATIFQVGSSQQAKERGTTPPPPPYFFLLQTLFGEGTLLSQCYLHPRVSVIGVMSGKLDKLLGEGGGVDLWLTSVQLRGVLLSPYILWTARASRNITQGIKLSIEQLHTFPSL